MRRIAISILVAASLAVALALPALAVTNGVPDGNRHPYVGLIVFDDANGPAWRCTGTLLSPTLVLTAGHCTDGAVAARVWFDEIVSTNTEYPFSGATSYDGTPHTFPGYTSPGHGLVGFSYGDVGVVTLSEPVPTSAVSTYGQLPSPNLVAGLAPKTGLDFVGYGVQYKLKISGPPANRWAGPRNRMFSTGELVSGNFRTSGDQIKVTMNPGGGSGGTCFGDSGGPDLLAGTSTVIAVNSYVTNYNCAGVGYDTRIDLPDRLAWIRSFLR
jgi:hypothetical protein